MPASMSSFSSTTSPLILSLSTTIRSEMFFIFPPEKSSTERTAGHLLTFMGLLARKLSGREPIFWYLLFVVVWA